jgi:hypothetical protein
LLESFKEFKTFDNRSQVLQKNKKWHDFKEQRKYLIEKYISLTRILRRVECLVKTAHLNKIIIQLKNNFKHNQHIHKMTVMSTINIALISSHWKMK